jgi:hypothetical protein
MPRHMSRQEPVWPTAAEIATALDDCTPTPFEAVPKDGVDAGAAHRAHMRALNAAAQERERGKDRTVRAHQVDVLAAEAERGHRRPRGAGWPATLRSVRTGKAE